MSRTRSAVPRWVSIVAVLLGLFATALGVLALLEPSRALGYVAGADNLASGWAGRNLGLGVALLVAVALRSPAGYVVAFAAQYCRELGDLIAAWPSVPGLLTTGVFVLVDVAGLVGALVAIRRTARTAPLPAGV